MIVLTIVLVVFGVFIQVISALSGLICRKRPTDVSESFSPILVPLLGPLSLTLAIILNKWPWWLILIACMTDLGTLVLLWYLPAIIREESKTSRFTCVMRLKGRFDNAHTVLTFHTSGKYSLQKRWSRPLKEGDAIETGELGTFAETTDGYALTSDEGIKRDLVRDGKAYRVKLESELPERCPYLSIAGWILV
ncbi:MAG: hypothetical protein JNK74_16125 [Candidatus Hydrogenedentes bacterium]|nr:hypothetical protein [Candidatus Hydrogenedentota bacterium]